jgi:hypothetical protein
VEADDDDNLFSLTVSRAGDFSVTEIVILQGPASGNNDKLSGDFSADPPVFVPEPATMAIMGSGLVGLGVSRVRRRGTQG